MFGKDFWRVIRMIYIILKALVEMKPPNDHKIEDLDGQ